jgi:rod shape-determining protein MreC
MGMRRFFSSRFFIVMLIIVLFLFGFMINMIADGGSTPPKTLVGLVVTPVQTFFKNISNGVEDFFATFSEYDSLKAENERLRHQVNKLEDELNASSVYAIENQKLKDLLGIKEIHPDYEYVYADIVSVGTSGLVSRFQINKGSTAGIEKKDIVITSDGLVGYVSSVSPYCADVTTILNTNVSVGAKITRTGDMAMTEGTLEHMAKGNLTLVYIPRNSNITRGDAVYTSGLNGTYPADVRIGKIIDIEIEDNGLSQYAVVEAAVDFSELKSVYVITNRADEVEND